MIAAIYEPLVPYVAEIYPQTLRQEPLTAAHPGAMACQRLATALGLGGVRVVIGGADVAVGVAGNR